MNGESFFRRLCRSLAFGSSRLSGSDVADAVYQASFFIMATVAIVGSEILKELGR